MRVEALPVSELFDLDCDLIRAIGQEDVWAGLRVVPIVGPTLQPPITPRSLLEVMTDGVRAALFLLTWWNLVPLACPDTGVCRHIGYASRP